MNTKKMVRIALIAALYAALTVALAPISYGPLQFRVSEALTVLPFLFPESVLGLFIGCLIANIYSNLGLPDIIFGSLATLLAAYLTGKMPKPYLAPLPPVIVNAVVVAFLLYYVLGIPLWLGMIQVAGGELGACYLLGLPLLYILKRYKWTR